MSTKVRVAIGSAASFVAAGVASAVGGHVTGHASWALATFVALLIVGAATTVWVALAGARRQRDAKRSVQPTVKGKARAEGTGAMAVGVNNAPVTNVTSVTKET